MTNDKHLSVAEALAKYKYQPYAEKRHEQLKSVFGVRPVWLKSASRVESLLWLYHVVELIQALLEREVRQHMDQEEIESLPLYPEDRQSPVPTAELVLRSSKGSAAINCSARQAKCRTPSTIRSPRWRAKFSTFSVSTAPFMDSRPCRMKRSDRYSRRRLSFARSVYLLHLEEINNSGETLSP